MPCVWNRPLAKRGAQQSSARSRMHQARIESVLARSPRLARMWLHRQKVNSIDFSPDGRLVVSGSDDLTARVWDAATGKPASRALVHGGALQVVAFSPDGKRVLTASLDGAARVWDLATEKVIASAFHPTGVNQAACSGPRRQARRLVGPRQQGLGLGGCHRPGNLHPDSSGLGVLG